jgi:lipopolysaccharide/colanic/teichoic acid biosynthesis glycosyltransferase
VSVVSIADDGVSEAVLELWKLELVTRVGSPWQKRVFDVALASVMLLVLLPVLLVVALAVKLGDRGPVFYRQRRVGFGGETFEIVKFRSMTPGADRLMVDLRGRNVSDGLLFKVVGDPRVTPVGRIIRRLSLDELPQLWNVLWGDMSLVGPRPLAVEPDSFSTLEHHRHLVRPGITGWWQIAGGNRLGYSQMISMDLRYVREWSIGLDIRLLARTIPALLDRSHVA